MRVTSAAFLAGSIFSLFSSPAARLLRLPGRVLSGRRTGSSCRPPAVSRSAGLSKSSGLSGACLPDRTGLPSGARLPDPAGGGAAGPDHRADLTRRRRRQPALLQRRLQQQRWLRLQRRPQRLLQRRPGLLRRRRTPPAAQSTTSADPKFLSRTESTARTAGTATAGTATAGTAITAATTRSHTTPRRTPTIAPITGVQSSAPAAPMKPDKQSAECGRSGGLLTPHAAKPPPHSGGGFRLRSGGWDKGADRAIDFAPAAAGQSGLLGGVNYVCVYLSPGSRNSCLLDRVARFRSDARAQGHLGRGRHDHRFGCHR